jgi:hypothetical protein
MLLSAFIIYCYLIDYNTIIRFLLCIGSITFLFTRGLTFQHEQQTSKSQTRRTDWSIEKWVGIRFGISGIDRSRYGDCHQTSLTK